MKNESPYPARAGRLLRWCILAALTSPVPGQAQVSLEYIAHACFVVESPAGERLAIDPYNGYRWLGYSFPGDVKAAAVLVTHPHYDHNADYYFGPGVPVFRSPGSYSVGDLRITGIRGKHADPYGKEFDQLNTIWLVESGNIRIAHLGDNGPLTPEMIRAMGRVDVLLVPIDGQDHILKRDEVAAILNSLKPSVTVPMHYQIPSLSDLPDSLGPIDPWLDGRNRVERLEGNRVRFDQKTIQQTGRILLLSPSPSVRAWSPALREAWSVRARAQEVARSASEGSRKEAAALLTRAVTLAPDVSVFSFELARMLGEDGRVEEAVSLLEKSLAGADRHDREYTSASHLLLAELYLSRGMKSPAAEQCRLVISGAYRKDLRSRAEALLGRIAAGR